MAQLARYPARRASFTEEKKLIALTAPLHSEGTLAYRKPDHLEKLTTAPHYESLVVDGDTLTIKDGPDNPPKTMTISNQPQIGTLIATIRGALSGDLPLLQKYYDVSGTGTKTGWTITLHPRDPAVAGMVRQVNLVGAAELQAIQSISPNGDSDTLTIKPLP